MNASHRFFLWFLPSFAISSPLVLLADDTDEKLEAQYSEAWVSYQNSLALMNAKDYQEALETAQRAYNYLCSIRKSNLKWEKAVIDSTLKDCEAVLPELTKLANTASDSGATASRIDLNTDVLDQLTADATYLSKSGDLEMSSIRLNQARILLDVLMQTDSSPDNKALQSKIQAMLAMVSKQVSNRD